MRYRGFICGTVERLGMRDRTKKRVTRRGKPVRVLDEDTLEGWPPFTIFLTCNNRGRLWHRAAKQSANILAVPMATLCGTKVYQGAEMRRTWEDLESVEVCTTCAERAADF